MRHNMKPQVQKHDKVIGARVGLSTKVSPWFPLDAFATGANVVRHAPWATGVAPSVDMVPRIVFVMSSVEAATGIFVVVLKRSHPRCPDGVRTGPRCAIWRVGGVVRIEWVTWRGRQQVMWTFFAHKNARATSFLVLRARSLHHPFAVWRVRGHGVRFRKARAGT